MRIIIVSGLSGSGKSVALNTLEDEGFYCVDNLPGVMLPALVDTITNSKDRNVSKLAVGIDARGESESIRNFLDIVANLKQSREVDVEVLFLDTNRNTLIRRFSETRRKHPLSSTDTPLMTAIRHETAMLTGIRDHADLVIDTSVLNLHQLRELITSQLVRKESSGPALLFQSFGFKHGIPAITDFIFDVRCLPNPYWETNLRALSGLEQPVVQFLEEYDSVGKMYEDIRAFIETWYPVFSQENRAYLTVSIGCTGGRHRSVYLANRLTAHFRQETGNVSARHRDMG